MLEEITTVSRSHGAFLVQRSQRSANTVTTPSTAEGVKLYFLNGWQNKDIRFERSALLIQAGQPIISDFDILAPNEIARSSFYQEHLIPNHFNWFALIPFRAGNDTWSLSLQRNQKQGPFEGDELRGLASLSLRLTEVATLSALVGRASLQNTLNALHRIGKPALTLDRRGSVIDVNESAEALFDNDFRVERGQIKISDPDSRSKFEILKAKLYTLPENLPLGVMAFSVRRRQDETIYVRALPIDGLAKSPFSGARAILTMALPSKRQSIEKQAMCEVFRLSPAETRLAMHLAEGKSLDSAAAMLCISKLTVRNHLKSIFSKTCTHRQAELVAKLTRLL